jgi:hypothetical protein
MKPLQTWSFKTKFRSLDSRVPISWSSENRMQKRRNSDFRLPATFLIFCLLDPNFAKGHKIRTLGSRDIIYFLKCPSWIGGLSYLCYRPIFSLKVLPKSRQSWFSIFREYLIFWSFNFQGPGGPTILLDPKKHFNVLKWPNLNYQTISCTEVGHRWSPPHTHMQVRFYCWKHYIYMLIYNNPNQNKF